MEYYQPRLFEESEPLPHETDITAESILEHELRQAILDERLTVEEAELLRTEYRERFIYPDDIYIEKKHE